MKKKKNPTDRTLTAVFFGSIIGLTLVKMGMSLLGIAIIAFILTPILVALYEKLI